MDEGESEDEDEGEGGEWDRIGDSNGGGKKHHKSPVKVQQKPTVARLDRPKDAGSGKRDKLKFPPGIVGIHTQSDDEDSDDGHVALA